LVAEAEATPPPPNLEPARFWGEERGLVVVRREGWGNAYLVVHGLEAGCEDAREALGVSRCWEIGWSE
jgi:hypothetical protein